MSFNFGGETYVSPTVASSVNDSAMLQVALPTGSGLVLIGASSDGQPNTPLTFSDPDSLEAALGSGDLVDAGLRAFNPSPDLAGPGQVTVIRVNPATAASLSINNTSSAALATLTAKSFGQKSNMTSASIQAGTVQGFALSANFNGKSTFKDNVYQGALSLTSSATTPTVTISATQLVLNANSTAVATIPFSEFQTIQAVADYINTVTGFEATVQPGAANLPSSDLDTCTAVALSVTPVITTATLAAIVSWFNSQSQFVTMALVASPAGLPATFATKYLTGGSDGTITNTQWSNALTAAQAVDVQGVVALSNSPTIHAMVSAHCAYMSGTGRSERRGYASGAIGLTDAQAISAAGAINSDRMAFVHLGIYDFDLTGTLSGLVLYQPYIHAAMVAAGMAGAGPGVAMTNKALNVQGMERSLQNPTNTDVLILGGVLCTAPDGSAFKVVQSVSTWMNDDKFNRVELSCGYALDYTVRSVRAAVKPFIGDGGSPLTLSKQLNAANTALKLLSTPAPNGPGVLVGDANSPAYTGLSVNLTGDAAVITFQCSPVIPLNYEGLSVYAVPYSGSLSASS